MNKTERTLYIYRQALQRGDLATMSKIAKQAEGDPELEKGIEEIEQLDAEDVGLADPTVHGRPASA